MNMNLHVNCTVHRICGSRSAHTSLYSTLLRVSSPSIPRIACHLQPSVGFYSCTHAHAISRPSAPPADERRRNGGAGSAPLVAPVSATVENPELREELLRVEPELARESPELRTPCRLARTAAAHGRWPSGVRFRNVGDGTSSSSGRPPHVYPVRISALGSGAPLATASRPARPVMGSRLQSGHFRACRC